MNVLTEILSLHALNLSTSEYGLMVRLLLELGSPKNSPDVEGWILVKTSIFLTHSNLQKSKQLTPILERLVEKELIDYAYNGQGYLKFRYPKIGTPLSKNRITKPTILYYSLKEKKL